MIRKKLEMETEVRERMRDGTGSVEILHVFRSRELKGHTRLFARLRLPAGSSIGFHRHQGEEEIFYILSGQGEVSEGGPATPVGPGDAMLTGDGAGHSISNTGHGSPGPDGRHPGVLRARRLMFPFRRRPFERLSTSFRWLEHKPFRSTREGSYTAAFESHSFVLSLHKESLFAWETLADGRRFSDFIADAEVEIDPSNGHSAVGLVFRHVNDENFYSFLLSSRGSFRIDAVFNNHPMNVVEWTRAPEPDPERRKAGRRSLRIIGHGSRLSFQVDEEWVAEAEDETLPEGTIGFAAQNFADSGPGVFRLRRLELEARPVVVEREHLRAWYYLPVSPASGFAWRRRCTRQDATVRRPFSSARV